MPTLMNIAHTLFAFVVSVTFAANGQAQIQNFKSGTYRGTMVVTTSIDDVGQTSATLKIAGRSAGDTVLKLIGTPQLALPLLNNAGDDYPIKTFSIEPSPVGESMSLYEVINTGFQKGTTIGLSLVAPEKPFQQTWQGAGRAKVKSWRMNWM